MRQINKHLHKGKTQIIGGFKLPYSLNGPIYKRPKWINENNTEQVEIVIGGLFVQHLRETEKRKALNFAPNPNDDHKKPDVFIHLDGKSVGVQITQFVLSDYLSKFNQAQRICEKISGFISDYYQPPIKINIQIGTPWNSDQVPRAPRKVYKKLSEEIANSISKYIKHLCRKNEYLNFDLSKTKFKDIAEGYNLLPVPNKYQSHYFGYNNIFVDYGFDNILIFEEDIKNTAVKIYNDKNNGDSEILLIWGDTLQFMNTDSLIFNYLEKQFATTSFKAVYFLTFQNVFEVKDRITNCKKVH